MKSMQVGTAALITALVVGCEGDSRPFEEAVEIRTENLVDLTVVPPTMSVDELVLNIDQAVQFTLEGRTANGETMELEATDRQWQVSDPAVADIDSDGRLTAKANGDVSVMLAVGGLEATSFDLTVSDSELVAIDGIAGSEEVERCVPNEFLAQGQYADGSVRDLYSEVAWSLAAGGSTIASLLTNPNAAGELNGLEAGAVTVMASISGGDFTAEKAVVVSDSLTALQIATGSVSIDVDDTQQFVAEGTYNGPAPGTTGEESLVRTLPITDGVVWEITSGSSNASVSNAADDRGEVTAESSGSATLVARCGSLDSPRVTLTISTDSDDEDVDDPSDLSFSITSLSVGVGETYTFRVSAGSTYDADFLLDNDDLTWTNNTSGAVTLSTAGVVTGQVINGSGTITVTHSNDESATITVEVN